MIKRINLIEKKAFSFTYLKLMQICMAVLLVNVLIVISQVSHVKYLRVKEDALQQVVNDLQAKQNELTKRPVKKKVDVGQYQDLFNRLNNTPHWAELLDQISKSMPNSLWITQFNSASQVPGTVIVQPSTKLTKKPEDKNTPPPSVPKINTLVLTGITNEIKNVTDFSRVLAAMRQMKNLTISNSDKDAFGFTFEIKGEVVANVR